MIFEKNALRQEVKQLKKQLNTFDIQQKSANIFNQLEQADYFINTQTVMVYWSMDDEVHTHDFIRKWADYKIILLPVVDGTALRIKQFQGMESMKPGSLKGILEPVGDDYPFTTNIDLIIVPGVAFDKNYNRMGRGKGFYDKLLLQQNSFKLGICFDVQLFESIPSEPHDIAMDLVIWA